jgi:hypothetical protein
MVSCNLGNTKLGHLVEILVNKDHDSCIFIYEDSTIVGVKMER